VVVLDSGVHAAGSLDTIVSSTAGERTGREASGSVAGTDPVQLASSGSTPFGKLSPAIEDTVRC
jgi:hypothetical protein